MNAAVATVLLLVTGQIVKTEPAGKGVKITITDGAGHLADYSADARTKTTCDGKTAAWDKDAVPGACDRVVKGRYEKRSKRLVSLELASALKADAAAAKTRATIAGEIAVVDVLTGKLSVRLGGGGNIDFKVGDATKVTRADKDAPFESLKVGERVEVRSADWKTADEIRVSPAN